MCAHGCVICMCVSGNLATNKKHFWYQFAHILPQGETNLSGLGQFSNYGPGQSGKNNGMYIHMQVSHTLRHRNIIHFGRCY